MENRFDQGNRPGDDMIAYALENIDPIIGNIDTRIHRIKIEQADAETGSETDKGHAGQQIEGIEPGIGNHAV